MSGRRMSHTTHSSRMTTPTANQRRSARRSRSWVGGVASVMALPLVAQFAQVYEDLAWRGLLRQLREFFAQFRDDERALQPEKSVVTLFLRQRHHRHVHR